MDVCWTVCLSGVWPSLVSCIVVVITFSYGTTSRCVKYNVQALCLHLVTQHRTFLLRQSSGGELFDYDPIIEAIACTAKDRYHQSSYWFRDGQTSTLLVYIRTYNITSK